MDLQTRLSYEQDINAMVRARTFAGVDDIARAMKGLGRWDEAAQEVFDRKLERLGQKNGGSARFSERYFAAQELWPVWVAAHPPQRREAVAKSPSIRAAFMAGAMMAFGKDGDNLRKDTR